MNRRHKSQALTNLNSLFEYSLKPVVAAIVTNFNYARYITECLSSIAAQDYPNWHCVIVDDASTDNSIEVIESFLKDNGQRFKLIRHELNGGQMDAFKTGLAATESEFVLFVDADDVLLPHCMTMLLAGHFIQGNVAFTAGAMPVINQDGDLKFKHLPQFAYDDNSCFTNTLPRPMFEAFWPWAATSSMLFRRTAVEKLLPEETNLFKICADFYIGQAANLLGGSIIMQDSVALYRVHGNNTFTKDTGLGWGSLMCDVGDLPVQKVIRRIITARLLQNAEFFLTSLHYQGLLYRLLLVATPCELFRRRALLNSKGITVRALAACYIRLRARQIIVDSIKTPLRSLISLFRQVV